MRTQSMQSRLRRGGAVLVTALVLSVVPVMANAEAQWDPDEATPVTTPGTAVSLERAGKLGLWGDNTYNQSTVPASLAGVAISQVEFPSRATLALTADGLVVGWGSNSAMLEKVPAEVAAAKVVQIAVSQYGGSYAGAVTSDGRVLMWGRKRAFATPLDVPEGLTGVKQLVLGSLQAAAVKNDGSVVTWGNNLVDDYNPPEWGIAPPVGLKATAIAVNGSRQFVALKPDGSLATWGYQLGASLPASVTGPGKVKAIVAGSYSFTALLANNTLEKVGGGGPPADYLARETVLLANGGVDEVATVDQDRVIRYWSGNNKTPAFPLDLDGQDIVQVAIGNAMAELAGDSDVPVGGVIITKMLRAVAPAINGIPTVGGTLSATPSTFSASPDSVVGQWLSNGSPLVDETGTSLTLTAALVGKDITYQSTATKAGETTISSTSNVVKVLGPASISLSAPNGSYGVAATVTISVPGATGNVSLAVDGKSVGTKGLVGSRAAFSVARTTVPGSHALSATYAGGPVFGPGSKTATLAVGKGRTGVPVLKIAKASPKKPGTATVIVATAAGLVQAGGTAQLVLKKGKSTKKVNLRVVNGKAVGKLPKLAKGTWTASVTYLGSGYYLPVKSRTIKVKSR